MPAITASAPGKAILFGEHAVVYHRPAIAVPVTQVKARASVFAQIQAPAGQVWLDAPDIHLSAMLDEVDPAQPLAILVREVQRELALERFPALKITIRSDIPLAAGLGSGAAVSVAAIRALSAFVGHPLPDETVSRIAYRVEQVHHGTPSGIDNTVITYAQPIWFLRGAPFELLKVAQPFTLVIADSGITSPTVAAVQDIRRHHELDPLKYDAIFDAIASVVNRARTCIEQGQIHDLGPLMDENHCLLKRLDVSCGALDHLVDTAHSAGALGAKLIGGGRGGNMIALVHAVDARLVAEALLRAGAVRTLITEVTPHQTQGGAC